MCIRHIDQSRTKIWRLNNLICITRRSGTVQTNTQVYRRINFLTQLGLRKSILQSLYNQWTILQIATTISWTDQIHYYDLITTISRDIVVQINQTY